MDAKIRMNINDLQSPNLDIDFQSLAMNIPALCWVADRTGYITWYNPRWYEYTGKTAAEMEGWGWQSVHDPRTLHEILERWTEAIASAKPFEMVFPIRGADGTFRPFLTRITPAFDKSGAVTGWFGVNTDISPLVEADVANPTREARFWRLANAMPQMVWSARPDGFHDYFNAVWYDFTGEPIGSYDEQTWRTLVPEEEQDELRRAWRASLSSGEPFSMEHRLRHWSGEFRWVLARAQPERDSLGNIIRWYGTSTDIEDIVRARRILQRSRDELEQEVEARTGERNLLATLMETTDVKIMAIDRDYAILALNQACAHEFERLFGRRPKAGDNLLTLLADNAVQQAAVRKPWARALNGEEFTVVEQRGDPAHASATYELTFRVLRDESGRQVGAFQFVHDVTERLRAEAKLAQAQEALVQSQKLEGMGQLTGGVAHDFNNLLTPILGSLDMLRRRQIGGEREQRLIEGAFQSADRAKLLVQRLLAFARRQPLQAASIDVGALVQGLAGLLRSTLGPQVNLTLDIADDLPAAKADPNQLEMAILNLSVNARDAMDGVGDLTIAAIQDVVTSGHDLPLAPGRYIRLAVRDTGVGMDELTLAKAVEPFFSTKGLGKGTGLGLSMAHGLASQLGGALTMSSQPGVGTEVVIWLPQSDQPIGALPGAVATDDLRAHWGVALLVDDEENIRISTADMLAELGFKVHEMNSADAALDALEGGLTPDLVITDHLMPGMTGVELAEAVRARWPSTKVLIMSGFANTDGIDCSIPKLTKPFVQSDLAMALADLKLELKTVVGAAAPS